MYINHFAVGGHIAKNIWEAHSGLDGFIKQKDNTNLEKKGQWEELGDGGEYDQNMFYTILKILLIRESHEVL